MALNLAAEEDGIGCCIMGAIDKKKITGIVNAGKNLELLYMVALGYKKEHPICTDITADGDVKYYLSENQLHVPKRKMDDVLIKIM